MIWYAIIATTATPIHVLNIFREIDGLKVTFTPMHGIGGYWMTKCFEAYKLPMFIKVPLQHEPDPEFSTVEFPRINEWLTEVERQMRLTLANNLAKAVQEAKAFREGNVECDPFVKWVDSFQVQIVALAAQITWSEDVEAALTSGPKALKSVLTRVEDMLKLLADLVLQNQPPLRRKKLEHLIYEYVHRRY